MIYVTNYKTFTFPGDVPAKSLYPPYSLQQEGAFSPEKRGVSLYSDADKRIVFSDLFQTAPILSPLVAGVREEFLTRLS